MHRAICLYLLIAAIGAWTTPHLEDAIAAARAEGHEIPDEYLAHLSPLAWNHVNLPGQYTFDPSQARSLEHRRPLRNGVGDDGEDDDVTG